ncbi:MAG: hypothetical protein EOP10_21770, partial [Proteobacteria bacterium]
MSLAQKEVFQASKILIDFLRDFTFLSEQQLLSSKKMLEGIVFQVMNSMSEVSDTSNQKVGAAKQVLVKDEKTGQFVASKTVAVEQKEVEAMMSSPNSEALRKIILESKLLRSSGSFSKHLEAISMLDNNLQKLLSNVIGAVSLDDVIA